MSPKSVSKLDVILGEYCVDWQWRIRNLYVFHDQDDGQIKPLRLNEAQEYFIANRAPFSLIVKTRREGFSTYVVTESVDWCIWKPGQIAAVIDYRIEDAMKKLRWAALCWQHMGKNVPGLTPDEGMALNKELQRMFPISGRGPGKKEIEWENGSIFYASASVRGGMVNCGHVSEMGRIAADKHDTAVEILAGMTPAVAPGNRLTLESTHEGGKYGKHWELISQALKKTGETYSAIEFKLLWFSFLNSNKFDNPNHIKFDEEEKQIIEDYRAQGVTMTPDRWAYWIQQYRKLRERTYCEFPILFDDIFRSPIEGSIYGSVLYKRQLEGAISAFPIEKRYPCYVGWDLGQADSMALWLLQVTPREYRLLDYYEASYQKLDHFVAKVRHWEDHCFIQNHFLPHDAASMEKTGKTFAEVAKEHGLKGVRVVPRTQNVWIGINEARSMLEATAFHKRLVDGYKDNTGKQITAFELLKNYRTKVVEDGKRQETRPHHDHTSHCADALRCLAEARILGWLSPHMDPPLDNRPLVVRR